MSLSEMGKHFSYTHNGSFIRQAIGRHSLPVDFDFNIGLDIALLWKMHLNRNARLERSYSAVYDIHKQYDDAQSRVEEAFELIQLILIEIKDEI